jgi:hypothetical protein
LRAERIHGTDLAEQLAMWLEAILTKEDLEEVVREFSPLEIHLGESGSLLLVAPREVALLPGEGLGVQCDATLHWPVLGFDVPVSMRALTVRILPRVEERPEGATLVFRLQIDHTGVSMLPSFFDDRVTARVNEELEQKHVELAWNFVDTLSHVFDLPPALASSAAFSLRATAGKVKTTESALGLAVDFEAKVKARAGSADAASSTSAPSGNGVGQPSRAGRLPDPGQAAPPGDRADVVPLPGSPGHEATRPFDSRSLAVGAAAAWLLLTGLRAVRSVGKRRRRWPG